MPSSNCPKCGSKFYKERANAAYCKSCDELYVKKGWVAPAKTHPSGPSKNPVLSVRPS